MRDSDILRLFPLDKSPLDFYRFLVLILSICKWVKEIRREIGRERKRERVREGEREKQTDRNIGRKERAESERNTRTG